MIFLQKCQVDVRDGAFVAVDETGERMQIPVGSIACIMLEPGTRISHSAAALAAQAGTLLLWVGEGGVRLYSAGQPGGARTDRLLYQARLALEDEPRLKVVRKMYELRFGEAAPSKRSVKQLQGIEGARVKQQYQLFAQHYGVVWRGRRYDVKAWEASDRPNLCLNVANHCLYGITEAAILAAGYAPAIGFIHSGKPLAFVYDIADMFKFEVVTPLAFKIAQSASPNPEQAVRHACRDAFRQHKVLKKLIPKIEEVLAAGGLEKPKPHKEAVEIAIPTPEEMGDGGHRS